MMDSVERSGKSVEEAIEIALRDLSSDREQVEITVLSEPTKGFLGLGGKAATVLVTKKRDPESAAKAFMREISAAMGMFIEVETKLTDNHLYVDLKGEKMGVLIGKRGQTLDSLQYLLNLVVNKGDAQYLSVTLDTENYRKRRRETLETLAFSLARKVKATKKEIVLEPMNPYERRVIHSVLQNDRSISTHSEGKEPFRNVVISPKHKQKEKAGV